MALSQNDAEKLQSLLDQMNAKERRLQRTTEIVSKFAYLIGVRYSIFENPHEPPDMEWYEKLEREKPARIIRNLCRIRTSMELNFGKIHDGMINQYRSIENMTNTSHRKVLPS